MQIFPNLKRAMRYAQDFLRMHGQKIEHSQWQGIEAPAPLFSVDNVYIRACMPGTKIALEEQTQPDLPWADDHFNERIGGKPLNPGEQYLNWPHYKKDVGGNDKKFRVAGDGKFTHTYMERFWPKYAVNSSFPQTPLKGIRYEYGDLDDVIKLLIKNPHTRQAVLPIWFPEDTGAKHGGRLPCSICYTFQRRGNDFHLHYLIRSCDFKRHFHNDVYMAVRLAQYVLTILKEHGNEWKYVEMGILTMDIIDLHVFYPERNLL